MLKGNNSETLTYLLKPFLNFCNISTTCKGVIHITFGDLSSHGEFPHTRSKVDIIAFQKENNNCLSCTDSVQDLCLIHKEMDQQLLGVDNIENTCETGQRLMQLWVRCGLANIICSYWPSSCLPNSRSIIISLWQHAETFFSRGVCFLFGQPGKIWQAAQIRVNFLNTE